MSRMHAPRDAETAAQAEAQEPVELERPSGSSVMQSAELAEASAPVQAKGALDAVDVHGTAQSGVAGEGQSLPHLDTVQQAFGHHDLSNVGAHVGGAATAACDELGAQAYATGSQVAFKSDPDLHTTAHEAAHVVQQRAGVHFKGGVGQAGDRYEQHADAVADRVVQGQSAVDLLDSVAGGGGSPAVQLENEEEGAWLQQQQLTKDSFFDLIRQNLLAADAWKTRAEVEDPPPLWQQALLAVGGLVLNAALGGVGGALVGRLTKDVTKFVVDAAIQSAVEAGKIAAGKGVDAAIGAASGAGDKKPLVAFCEQQKIGMSAASKKARESFVHSAGTFTDQKMTIAQMAEIKRANDASFERAQQIQAHEMLVGWMGMNAGKTDQASTTDSNVEDIDNDGILRLTVAGSNDRPTRIIGATVDGLNAGLRGEIGGSKVREWRRGARGADGQVRQQGIDVLVTTGSPGSDSNSFRLSNATWRRLAAAGQAPSSTYVSGARHSVFFSFFVERGGQTSWTDTDMDWSIDWNFGATAGRWFLDNVRSTFDILRDLDNLTIPSSVSG